MATFAAHITKGLFSARPSASSVPAGSLYAATDTNVVYQSDGVSTWATYFVAGSVASDTIWDTKGDLVVASGPDAASKLPVGTDTYVLTADAAQTLGVKWAPASGGGTSIGYGTSLPGSPSNGDMFILVDSTSAPTYQWMLRFNSSEATYKWEFVGGVPIVVSGSANVVVSSATVASSGWFYDPTTMSKTLAHAGEYLIEGTIQFGSNGGAANFIEANVFVVSTMQNQFQGGIWVTAVNTVNTCDCLAKVTVASASSLVGIAAATGANGTFKLFGLQQVKITPYRII